MKLQTKWNKISKM